MSDTPAKKKVHWSRLRHLFVVTDEQRKAEFEREAGAQFEVILVGEDFGGGRFGRNEKEEFNVAFLPRDWFDRMPKRKTDQWYMEVRSRCQTVLTY